MNPTDVTGSLDTRGATPQAILSNLTPNLEWRSDVEIAIEAANAEVEVEETPIDPDPIDPDPIDPEAGDPNAAPTGDEPTDEGEPTDPTEGEDDLSTLGPEIDAEDDLAALEAEIDAEATRLAEESNKAIDAAVAGETVQDDAPEDEAKDDEGDEEPKDTDAKDPLPDDLASLNRDELATLARQRGHGVSGQHKKSDIIEMILSGDKS